MHRERYGYAIEGETIELVSFKVTAVGRRPRFSLREPGLANGRAPQTSRDVFFRENGWVPTTVLRRPALGPGTIHTGPLLIQEDGSTTLVPPGMTVRKSKSGSLVITTGADR
jgi:N-methylhydantoinase A